MDRSRAPRPPGPPASPQMVAAAHQVLAWLNTGTLQYQEGVIPICDSRAYVLVLDGMHFGIVMLEDADQAPEKPARKVCAYETMKEIASVLTSISGFKSFITQADNYLHKGRYGAAAVSAEIAACYATWKHAGLFVNPELQRWR